TPRLPPVGGSTMPARKVQWYVDAGCRWYERTTRILPCIARRRLARGTKQLFQRTHGRDSRWTRLPSLESPSARLHRLDRSLSVRGLVRIHQPSVLCPRAVPHFAKS